MLYEIYFSPTGGTKKVVEVFDTTWNKENTKIDLIKNPQEVNNLKLTENDICFFAVPSYGGRVPSIVLEILNNLQGKGAKAILGVVYGNRAIDDTLMELSDFLSKKNFIPIAAFDAVAEHSLMRCFGKGRPDIQDKTELTKFANLIEEKIQNSQDISKELQIPGNHEYRSYNGVPFKPITTGKCNSCGLCAKECPVQAINIENPKITDNEKCISCMHCISVCPQKARKLSKLLVWGGSFKMRKRLGGHKENHLYL